MYLSRDNGWELAAPDAAVVARQTVDLTLPVDLWSSAALSWLESKMEQPLCLHSAWVSGPGAPCRRSHQRPYNGAALGRFEAVRPPVWARAARLEHRLVPAGDVRVHFMRFGRMFK